MKNANAAAKTELPKGYTCTCGTEHAYPGYVYAHWNESLTHTCETCQAQHEVIRGIATLIKEGKK